MKLPRRTDVFTVNIVMRSGAVIEKDFFQFTWTYNGEGISKLNWQEVQGTFWVDRTEIAAITLVGIKKQIRWR